MSKLMYSPSNWQFLNYLEMISVKIATQPKFPTITRSKVIFIHELNEANPKSLNTE